MIIKIEDLYIISCYCVGCSYFHNDEIYTSIKEAEEKLDLIKEKQQNAKIEKLPNRLCDIEHSFY